MSTQSNTIMYKKVNEWELTATAKFTFEAYQQQIGVSNTIRSEISKEFYTQNTAFENKKFEVTCKKYEGTVNLYQWVWISTNTSGKTYHVATPSYLCTYGINVRPQCPISLCLDETCQTCKIVEKPIVRTEAKKENIVDSELENSFGTDFTKVEEPIKEKAFQSFQGNFFAESYQAASQAVTSVEDLLGGFFSSKKVDETN